VFQCARRSLWGCKWDCSAMVRF